MGAHQGEANGKMCPKSFFPNQACLWGSYSNERISVRRRREGGSPVTQGPVPPKILVPRSWYQDLGTKILVPRSWYQDLRGNRSLGDGGTALSLACNRYPFFTVRTLQASLVGEHCQESGRCLSLEHQQTCILAGPRVLSQGIASCE